MLGQDSMGISVIIPVYNTSEFLARCLDSVLSQTFSNLQIIIVDDCSTDRSRDIINSYKSHNNIEVIFNEANRGAAYCRNAGLKRARYKYIGFIDSDDFIACRFYELLYNELIQSGADIAVCDFHIVSKENEMYIEATQDGTSKYSFINHSMAASPCNKIFKKDLIEQYPFPVGIMNEDIASVIPAMVHADKICYVPKSYYNYVQHKSSVQNSALSIKRFDIFKAVDIAINRIQNVNGFEKYKNAVIFNQLILLLVGVIPKEERFGKRLKYLRIYNSLLAKYKVDPDLFVKEYLLSESRKMRIYYYIVLTLTKFKFAFVTNCAIGLYKRYKKFREKKLCNVIKQDIKESDLIAAAKKQSLLKDLGISISVIIPNYNYARFLFQRVFSILEQTVKLKEIIILDDHSSDDSKDAIEIIRAAVSPYINVKTQFNDINSGSPFIQWERGLKIATGNYIWIAEADDFCSSGMLEKLAQPILKDNEITISYCNTAFIDGVGNQLGTDIVSMIDLMHTRHWKASYVNDGYDELMNYTFLNCTISNVSSVLFKANVIANFDEITQYKQVGDWLFYILLMSKGKVAYIHETLNYYRLHGNNVSNTTKKEDFLDETIRIHQFIKNRFGLKEGQKQHIVKRYKFLIKIWELKNYLIDKKSLSIIKNETHINGSR